MGEEKVEEEDLNFLEEREIWGDDVEIEDLVRIAQIDNLEKIIENDGIEGGVDINMFEFVEQDIAELNSLEESVERVRVLRELGEGTTISVGKDCKKLCCNCEIFNRWRICRHVIFGLRSCTLGNFLQEIFLMLKMTGLLFGRTYLILSRTLMLTCLP